jgi:hypothetical protein
MATENQYYNVDVAMLGDVSSVPGYHESADTLAFEHRIVDLVCEYLTEHGYPATSVTDSYNGASNDRNDPDCVEPPDDIWSDALAYASQHVND